MLNPRHARSRCPAACCYRFVPSAFTTSTNAPTGSSCRWTGVGAAVLVSCLHYTPRPRLRREALARFCTQPSNPPCMGRYLLHNCTCTVLFVVPDFPGNLAVFIPGKSGMKKSGNPWRPGNGSPGMNSLVASVQL